MTTFNIIKTTPFDTNGIKGTTFTLGHKGYVINASSLNFEEGDLVATKDKLQVNCNVVLKKTTYINNEGNKAQGLQLMRKLDIEII